MLDIETLYRGRARVIYIKKLISDEEALPLTFGCLEGLHNTEKQLQINL